jgi:hypothetical protein
MQSGGPSVNSLGKSHYKKYFSLGHKHFAPGKRITEKEGFQGIRVKNFVLKTQSGGRLLIL